MNSSSGSETVPKMFQKRMSSCCLAMIVLLNVMWNSGLAQSPTSPDMSCTTQLLSLLNCEPFLAGDNVSTPADSCCAGLNDLVRAAPTCLCGVISGNANFPTINLTRAAELPDKCGIPIAKSQCSALAAPPPGPPSPSSSDSSGILAPPGSRGSKLSVSSSLMCSWAVLSSIAGIAGPFSR